MLPVRPPRGGTKTIIPALLANLGIAVSKFVAFLIVRSSARLAESIHSLADSGSQVLLLVGGGRASREATPEHPQVTATGRGGSAR